MATESREPRRPIEELSPREAEILAELRDALVRFGARMQANRAMAAGMTPEATKAMAAEHMEEASALMDTLAGVALTEVLEMLGRWMGPQQRARMN